MYANETGRAFDTARNELIPNFQIVSSVNTCDFCGEALAIAVVSEYRAPACKDCLKILTQEAQREQVSLSVRYL